MSQQIIEAGLDVTLYPNITGANLVEMFTGATFAPEIGGVITTLDDAGGNPQVPNANGDTTLQNFIWVRIGYPTSSGVFVTAYLWNPNSANPSNPVVLLNWNSITSNTIGPATIQGFMIAPNTIPASALIGGITSNQVVGLTNLMLTALTASSTPAAGSVSGSFGSGFTLSANAINSVTQLANGIISQASKFSGTPILPSFIDTTTTAPAASSVLMAINGPGQPAAWQLKAILTLPEPVVPAQIGYIPVVQASGAYNLVAPTAAFPAGAISTAAEIQGGQAITMTSVNNSTGNTWVCSTASTGNLVANQTYVNIQGMGTKFTALNGLWLVTAVNAGVSFTVVTSGPAAGSGTTTVGTCKYADTVVGTTPLNVASIQLGTAGAATAGLYTLVFITPRSNTNYLVFAQALDTSSGTGALFAKVIQKLTTSVTIQIQSINNSAVISNVDNANVSIITL